MIPYSLFRLNWIFFLPLAIWYKGSHICNKNLPRSSLNSICLWSHSSFSIHISLPPNLPHPSSREDRSALAWKMGSIAPIHSGHLQRRLAQGTLYLCCSAKISPPDRYKHRSSCLLSTIQKWTPWIFHTNLYLHVNGILISWKYYFNLKILILQEAIFPVQRSFHGRAF